MESCRVVIEKDGYELAETTVAVAIQLGLTDKGAQGLHAKVLRGSGRKMAQTPQSEREGMGGEPKGGQAGMGGEGCETPMGRGLGERRGYGMSGADERGGGRRV